jgi:hypothetical protein
MENNKRKIHKLKLKFDFEKIYLIIFFFLLLWASIANLWGNEISPNFTFNYMASDAFQHQVRADSIKQMSNYKYESHYIAGRFKDEVDFYPPLMYNLNIIMSYASKLEIYDISYILTFIIGYFYYN